MRRVKWEFDAPEAKDVKELAKKGLKKAGGFLSTGLKAGIKKVGDGFDKAAEKVAEKIVEKAKSKKEVK